MAYTPESDSGSMDDTCTSDELLELDCKINYITANQTEQGR